MKIEWLNDALVFRPENRKEKQALAVAFARQLAADDETEQQFSESVTKQVAAC